MHYHPPSPKQIASLPTHPLRMLVSGCLAGMPCGTDGTDYGASGILADLIKHKRVESYGYCPEEVAFGTPRATPDCVGGNGFAVIAGRARVLSDLEEDWTEGLVQSAKAMCQFALDKKVDIAILQHVSAACGTSVIYDGDRREKKYQLGPGVAAAMLMKSGITVVGTMDRYSLELLRHLVDPEHQTAPDARNHHESEWYQNYFGSFSSGNVLR